MPHTLLLADDSVTIQRVIELTFADEEVKVVAVGDGDAAIARLDTAPPDIVLADVSMPGKSGYEVAQYVKQSPRLSHIPVVLLTGAFEPVDQARADQAGCDGVLAKPFEPQHVIGRVKELLAAHPKGGGTAEPAVPVSEPAPQMTPDFSNYFDRLDAAFATVPTAPSPPEAAAEPEPASRELEPRSQSHETPDSADEATPAAGEVSPLATEPPHILEPPHLLEPDAPRSVADQIDWFAMRSEAMGDAPDLPLAHEASPSVFEALETRTPEPEPDVVRDEIEHAVVTPIEAAAPSAPSTEAAAPAAPSTEAAAQAPPIEPAAALVAPVAEAVRLQPVRLPALSDAFAALLAAEEGDTAAAPIAWPSAGPSAEALADQITRRVLDQVSMRVDTVVRTAVVELVSDLAERLIRDEIERIKATIK